MSTTQTWAATLATVILLLGYEAGLLILHRARPALLARSAHATLREEWFAAISRQAGSEVLAVQTLRNSLMSATLTASTAALGLMGTVTLASPSLNDSLAAARTGLPFLDPRAALELMLMAALFASLVCSAMAMRYYTHASFIGSMPVDSPERRRWSETGSQHLRRAGLLYSWGLRHLVLVAPIVACILHPLAGPVAGLVVTAVLYSFDRVLPR